jgi:hypothetical protein
MNNREKGTIFKISTLIQLTQFADAQKMPQFISSALSTFSANN